MISPMGHTPFDTSRYHFELPDELIATHPLKERSASRLMVIHRKSKKIEHAVFSDLNKYLPPHAMLVANNSKVIRARLLGEREGTGGKVEFFILNQLPQSEAKAPPYLFQGLMKAGAKIEPGFSFMIPGTSIRGVVVGRQETVSGTLFTAEFNLNPLELNVGEVPLPPYIRAKRESLLPDELEVYNTAFAKNEGSVAAPTAGRHFTENLIAKLREQGFSWEEITLHVGLGTFKPVTAKDLREHLMHAETTLIDQDVSERISEQHQKHQPLIAVGTTAARTLEGRARVNEQHKIYCDAGLKDVNIYIYPGSTHQWKLVNGMITNFHLPESTLLMMIADFVGDVDFLLQCYKLAILEKYRFYSYGDAMLIL